MSIQKALRVGAIYLVLLAFAAYFLMPFYVMLITGLKPFEDVNVTTMWHLPIPPTWVGFYEGWITVTPNFRNSVVITVPAALISAFIGSINGYVFAKWRFPGSDIIFLAFLVGMFLPYQGILIPLVQTLQFFERLTSLNFYGSMWALVMVHCIFGIPITALLFRGYYAGIPRSAAGCGQNRRLRFLWHLSPYLAAHLVAGFRRGTAVAVHDHLE